MTTNFSFNNDSASAFKGWQFSILLAELFDFSINNFKLSFLLAIQVFEEPMLEKRQILYCITRDGSHKSFSSLHKKLLTYLFQFVTENISNSTMVGCQLFFIIMKFERNSCLKSDYLFTTHYKCVKKQLNLAILQYQVHRILFLRIR